MYIPGYLITIIALALWWHYCWMPARNEAKYWKRMTRSKPPKPELPPFTREWLYEGNPVGLIQANYRDHLRSRGWKPV